MNRAFGLWLSILLGTVRPAEDIRFTHVFPQLHDYSCGAASISSLASIYWGFGVMESDLSARAPTGPVSMFDLLRLLEYLGFTAGGFELSYEELRRASLRYGPLIVHLADRGGHFALFLGGTVDFAFLAGEALLKHRIPIRLYLISWPFLLLASVLIGIFLGTSWLHRQREPGTEPPPTPEIPESEKETATPWHPLIHPSYTPGFLRSLLKVILTPIIASSIYLPIAFFLWKQIEEAGSDMFSGVFEGLILLICQIILSIVCFIIPLVIAFKIGRKGGSSSWSIYLGSFLVAILCVAFNLIVDRFWLSIVDSLL